jgi:limonene-1,2-epoxide hydrolase
VLAVQPQQLRIAADRLRVCAERVDTARTAFADAAAADLPSVGRAAADPATRTARSADHACAVLAADLCRMAAALSHLAVLYQRLDDHLLAGPGSP